MADELRFLTISIGPTVPLPYVENGIWAGFPSPAQDYLDKSLDLNRDLIKHPEATFYARITGDSMEPCMKAGDVLVVDRSIAPNDGCTAVCFLNGEFIIKQLDLSQKKQGKILLISTNKKYAPIEVTKDEHFEIWGVVRYIIHTIV